MSQNKESVFVVIGVLSGALDVTFVVSSHHQNALVLAAQNYREKGRPEALLAGVFSEEEFEMVYKSFNLCKKSLPSR